MPDALQMLRDDHNEVKEIFKKFSSTEDTRMRKELAHQAMVKLEVHSKLEDEFFYPAVRAEGDTTQLMNEAEEEHHVADLLMEELQGMSPNDDRYEAKFAVLAELVRHHIDEEESEIFPRAAELGQDRLRKVGEQMEKRKPALMEQAEKPKRKTAARASRGRATARRTTRPTSSRGTSGRSTRASASRSTGGHTSRSTSGTKSTRGAGRTMRSSGTRSTSGGTTGRASASDRGARAGTSARTTTATRTRTPGRSTGTSRGRTATESRRRTASRTSSSRQRTTRR